MTAIQSVQAGLWSATSTWSTGTVPAAGDAVTLYHTVTVAAAAACASCLISTGGSLIVKPSITARVPFACPNLQLTGVYPDTRDVLMTGAYTQPTAHACLSCVHNDWGPSSEFWANTTLWFDGNTGNIGGMIAPSAEYTMDEAPLPNVSQTEQDQTGRGEYRPKARSLQGVVSSITVTVKWPRSAAIPYGELLRRMAASPFPVLLVTPSTVMKGYLESVQYTATDKSFYRAQLTVTEG